MTTHSMTVNTEEVTLIERLLAEAVDFDVLSDKDYEVAMRLLLVMRAALDQEKQIKAEESKDE